ncbi:heavy metal-binding domain-containing protein [Yeosuana sp. MJ-SS3]|uniref:Heavy metal-binding domain-containing protein n=1 Tax=Gilvirhabdus luticola TaxID=3079858 RepID=A0ABU3U5S8_9FLAO|nr:heavy metal-binding domain-containing protein [Yeosuana sp. MJ-SS3]MDU8885759.1 heavy metal-binding domain-containing protein [Yeosuana sp. MJ-SS3]
MKKTILALALIFGLSTVTFSCKDKEKQVSETEMHEAQHDKYKCPMECEEEKTYDEPGKCPVCKMDLQKVKEE